MRGRGHMGTEPKVEHEEKGRILDDEKTKGAAGERKHMSRFPAALQLASA